MVLINIESLEEFEGYLNNSGNKLIVVDFTAHWCGPCKMIGPTFEAAANDPDYADVIFLKVDVDECQEVSMKCEINCMPTFHCYRNGKRQAELSGANVEKLKELIKSQSKQQ
ncbi:thioredoxin b [Syngnathus scovelli]|uniref:thioredoxin b n=1 Tax=Syngnathus scovelli TaxID=161590 RepID=UPI00210F96B8|nr:thioredoxin [Syngnathus scovelli]